MHTQDHYSDLPFLGQVPTFCPYVPSVAPYDHGLQKRFEIDLPSSLLGLSNNHPEELAKIVALLEKEFGRKAAKEMLPMQPGDVLATYADVDDLMREVGFSPSTTIEDGIARFAAWFRDYHQLS